MKIKKVIAILLSICILIGVGAVGINGYMVLSAKEKILTVEDAAKLEDVDCILVLGCLVWSETTPSHMLADRLSVGVELYKSGAAQKILMSGDHGRKDYDEVNVMKNFAVDEGVESENIFMDHAGFSTYESMYRAKEVFKAKKIIIVTQGYHLPRAIYCAQALGLEAYGVSADLRNYGKELYNNTREFAARVKDFGYCIVKPEPTYLGEAVPINGDGNITNDK
ncbi:MAG: YdcF family protein [Clostridia bacterium]|nr:YdcF family protein [Clostridia bacterium]